MTRYLGSKIEEYIQKAEEYNNHRNNHLEEKRVKVVEPPPELEKVIAGDDTIGVTTDVRFLHLQSQFQLLQLKMKTGLALGLAFILLSAGIVFGAESLKSTYQNTQAFYSQKVSPLSE